MERPSRNQVEVEPAGERMNAWVAEYVMGGDTGPYSTCLEMAWLVLGKLRETDDVELFFRRSGSVFCEGPGWGQGDTVELAICRAALSRVLEWE